MKAVFSYSLKSSAIVLLKIYDINGKEIASLLNKEQESGEHTIHWNAAGYPSSVYYYKLISNGIESDTKRMILIK